MSIQNKYGRHPNKWDCTGTIVQARDFNNYFVKVDGFGRLNLGNAQHASQNRCALSETASGNSHVFQKPSESEQPSSSSSNGHLGPVAGELLSSSKAQMMSMFQRAAKVKVQIELLAIYSKQCQNRWSLLRALPVNSKSSSAGARVKQEMTL